MTNGFINNILSIKKDNIPSSIYNYARQCLDDYSACAIAGAKLLSRKQQDYLQSFASEQGVSTVIGFGKSTTMQTAALLNGISAHVLELDDGHRIGMVHLEAPIISVLLAVAEKENLKSDDFLYGIIIGYEVAIRLACAIQPACKLKGFHATCVCGTIGGAMAIGAALDFTPDQMKSAFSAAITSASGVLEMIEGDTELKTFNAGNAAMNAVTAAYIGKAGFKAPADALGGKRGFLKIFGDDIKMEYLTDFKKDFYYINTIYNKPYASCRHTHPAIEAAMNIRNQSGFTIDDIESIHVNTYKLAVSGHDHTEIDGVNSAKMSIPYSLAVALVTGKAGLDEYSESWIKNVEVLNIASRVTVTDADKLSALCPKKRIAEVVVKTKSGSFSSRIEYPKGEPENPLTPDEFYQKILGLFSFAGYSEERVRMIIDYVNQPKFEIRELMKML